MLILSIFHHQIHRLGSYLLASDNILADEAQSTIDGHITINQVFNGSEVGDNQRRSSRGNEDFVTIGLSLGKCQYRGWRYLVGLETHQRTIDVKIQGV